MFQTARKAYQRSKVLTRWSYTPFNHGFVRMNQLKEYHTKIWEDLCQQVRNQNPVDNVRRWFRYSRRYLLRLRRDVNYKV
jgi:hypothetical protein